MAKKTITKAELIDEIQFKIQQLNLLASALKSDRSRKPEALLDYQKKYSDILKG
jgi:hypothetical protein